MQECTSAWSWADGYVCLLPPHSRFMLPTPEPQVQEALGDGGGLTDATLELFTCILERLPPTPSRFHYVFNLRDLSRVYEGLLRATPEQCAGCMSGASVQATLCVMALPACLLVRRLPC
jgi:hypothetical protein